MQKIPAASCRPGQQYIGPRGGVLTCRGLVEPHEDDNEPATVNFEDESGNWQSFAASMLFAPVGPPTAPGVPSLVNQPRETVEAAIADLTDDELIELGTCDGRMFVQALVAEDMQRRGYELGTAPPPSEPDEAEPAKADEMKHAPHVFDGALATCTICGQGRAGSLHIPPKRPGLPPPNLAADPPAGELRGYQSGLPLAPPQADADRAAADVEAVGAPEPGSLVNPHEDYAEAAERGRGQIDGFDAAKAPDPAEMHGGEHWRLNAKPDVVGHVVSLTHCRPGEGWVELGTRHAGVYYPFADSDHLGRGTMTLADVRTWSFVRAGNKHDSAGEPQPGDTSAETVVETGETPSDAPAAPAENAGETSRDGWLSRVLSVTSSADRIDIVKQCDDGDELARIKSADVQTVVQREAERQAAALAKVDEAKGDATRLRKLAKSKTAAKRPGMLRRIEREQAAGVLVVDDPHPDAPEADAEQNARELAATLLPGLDVRFSRDVTRDEWRAQIDDGPSGLGDTPADAVRALADALNDPEPRDPTEEQPRDAADLAGSYTATRDDGICMQASGETLRRFAWHVAAMTDDDCDEAIRNAIRRRVTGDERQVVAEQVGALRREYAGDSWHDHIAGAVLQAPPGVAIEVRVSNQKART